MGKLLSLLLSLFDLLAIIEELSAWIKLVLVAHSGLMRPAALATLMLFCSEELSLVLQHWVDLGPTRFNNPRARILMRFGTVPLPRSLLMMRLERITHKLFELVVLFLSRLDRLCASWDLLALHPLERQRFSGVPGLRRLGLFLLNPLKAIGLDVQSTSSWRAPIH